MAKYSWRNIAELIGVFSIVAGLLLVAYELRQNSQLLRAQVFNDRSGQGIEVFLEIAASRDLSEIDALLSEGGFPENPTAHSQLNPIQKRQLAWFMRAERFRLENFLYQQSIGAIEYDDAHINGAKHLIKRYDALGEDDIVIPVGDPTYRLKALIAQLEEMYEQVN